MLLQRTRTEPQDARDAESSRGGRSDNPCPSPEAIVRYVLGELDDHRADGVDSHLRDCPRCRAEIQALRLALEVSLSRDA